MALKNLAVNFNQKFCINSISGGLEKSKWFRENRKRKIKSKEQKEGQEKRKIKGERRKAKKR